MRSRRDHHLVCIVCEKVGVRNCICRVPQPEPEEPEEPEEVLPTDTEDYGEKWDPQPTDAQREAALAAIDSAADAVIEDTERNAAERSVWMFEKALREAEALAHAAMKIAQRNIRLSEPDAIPISNVVRMSNMAKCANMWSDACKKYSDAGMHAGCAFDFLKAKPVKPQWIKDEPE